MPHDRLRFAWIPPPRGARLPRRNARQERQPNEKGPAPTPVPCVSTPDISARERAWNRKQGTHILVCWQARSLPSQNSPSVSARHPVVAALRAVGLKIAAQGAGPKAAGVAAFRTRPWIPRVPGIAARPGHLPVRHLADRDHRITIFGATRHSDPSPTAQDRRSASTCHPCRHLRQRRPSSLPSFPPAHTRW